MDNKEAIEFLKNMIAEKSASTIGREGFFVELMYYHIESLKLAIKALDNENKLLQLCDQLEQEKGVNHIHINDVRTILINDCTTCKYGLEDIDFEKCVKCRETQGYGEWESEYG